MDERRNRAERTHFLILALMFEGGLLVVAVVLGALVGHLPWTNLNLSFESLGMGTIATLPLLGFLTFTYYTRFPALVRLRELTDSLVGTPLRACGWLDLCWIAILAGVSEEFLFRGVLQPWLATWGQLAAIIVCNLAFGLCHAITPTYFVFATIVGIYLSLTLRLTPEPNLAVPICCHALYDFVAFIVIRSARDKSDLQTSPNAAESLLLHDSANPPNYPDIQ